MTLPRKDRLEALGLLHSTGNIHQRSTKKRFFCNEFIANKLQELIGNNEDIRIANLKERTGYGGRWVIDMPDKVYKSLSLKPKGSEKKAYSHGFISGHFSKTSENPLLIRMCDEILETFKQDSGLDYLLFKENGYNYALIIGDEEKIKGLVYDEQVVPEINTLNIDEACSFQRTIDQPTLEDMCVDNNPILNLIQVNNFDYTQLDVHEREQFVRNLGFLHSLGRFNLSWKGKFSLIAKDMANVDYAEKNFEDGECEIRESKRGICINLNNRAYSRYFTSLPDFTEEEERVYLQGLLGELLRQDSFKYDHEKLIIISPDNQVMEDIYKIMQNQGIDVKSTQYTVAKKKKHPREWFYDTQEEAEAVGLTPKTSELRSLWITDLATILDYVPEDVNRDELKIRSWTKNEVENATEKWLEICKDRILERTYSVKKRLIDSRLTSYKEMYELVPELETEYTKNRKKTIQTKLEKRHLEDIGEVEKERKKPLSKADKEKRAARGRNNSYRRRMQQNMKGQ